MSVLTKDQLEDSYFKTIGGFSRTGIIKELKDYKGEKKLCIACTQLTNKYTEKDKKRILNEWIEFLKTDTEALTSLHFNSHVTHALFDAACCQKNLEELRFKWGNYSDLSALRNLPNLKYLYIGSGARVSDISVLSTLKELVVLFIENFNLIDDYTSLSSLMNLEQLVISGPILAKTPVRDLDFLLDMKSLSSIWIPNTHIAKKYTRDELDNLRRMLPNLHDVNKCVWGAARRPE